MDFWADVFQLRKQGQISRTWKTADLRPHLQKRYSENTIERDPYNSSIARDGKAIGNFVKRGWLPKAWRVGRGEFQLVVDPDDDATTQDVERGRAQAYAHVARAIAAGDPYPLRGLPLKYDRPFDPVALEDWEALK
jgi:hypothetical protein